MSPKSFMQMKSTSLPQCAGMQHERAKDMYDAVGQRGSNLARQFNGTPLETISEI